MNVLPARSTEDAKKFKCQLNLLTDYFKDIRIIDWYEEMKKLEKERLLK